MSGTGGGESPNLIHKPQSQTCEFHPLDRLPSFIKLLPDTTIDRRTNGKSPIADWNSEAIPYKVTSLVFEKV